MENLKEILLSNILNELPDIEKFNSSKIKDKHYDFFCCSLGFEERCLSVPEKLAEENGFKVNQAVYFEYCTNIVDNDINKPRLISALNKISENQSSLPCDEDDFTKRLRDFLKKGSGSNPRILFDISVCSSKLLLSAVKVFFEMGAYLDILYSEAAIYHPTLEEYEKAPQDWEQEEGFGIARGVSNVMPNPEYPGCSRNNPDLIIIFPTFKPERARAIISFIDDSLLIRNDSRIIWIVGEPHMDKESQTKRMEIIKKINKIDENKTYEVSTLNYKKTLEVMELIYKTYNLKNNINVASLGSKMQSLGIAVFCHLRPEVSVYHAMPKEYNPNQYSEGCKEMWFINFGEISALKEILFKVGKLEFINIKP